MIALISHLASGALEAVVKLMINISEAENELGVSPRVRTLCLRSEARWLPRLRGALLIFLASALVGVFGGNPLTTRRLGGEGWAWVDVDRIARRGSEEWLVVTYRGERPGLRCAPIDACLFDVGTSGDELEGATPIGERTLHLRLVPLRVGVHELSLSQGPRSVTLHRFTYP